MPQIGMCGTFDVENYGDVLFPLIAERELTDRLGSVNLQRFSYFEKAPPRWPYKVTSLAELPKIAASLDGMIIGGGHLIRFDKHIAPGYQPPLPDIHHPTGYWLNPALLALHHGCPVVWNAPGAYGEVPHWARPLMELAIKFSAYVAVRDEPARQMLAPFANARDIAVVPDTCFGIPSIVDPKRPSQDFSTFRQSLNILDPYLVIQATGGLDAFVRLLREHADRFAGYRLVSLRMGPIHGDDDNVLRDVPGLIQLPGWPHPLVMAELIAGAKGAVGVSLHLAITALAFGVPVFRPKNACTGKYAILAGHARVFWFDDEAEIDADWFLTRLGKRPVDSELFTIAGALNTHWDRVASCIRKVRSPQTSAALWQRLPHLLEAESASLKQQLEQESGKLQELHQVRAELEMAKEELSAALGRGRQQVAALQSAINQRDATIAELRNSTSWKATAALRWIGERTRWGRSTRSVIRFSAIERETLTKTPFEWAFLKDVFSSRNGRALADAFPRDNFKTECVDSKPELVPLLERDGERSHPRKHHAGRMNRMLGSFSRKGLRRPSSMEPRNMAARLTAVAALEALGRWDEALLKLDRVLESAPAHEEALSGFERIAEKSGNGAAALAMWDSAIGRFPERREYRLRREMLRLRVGDERAACDAILALAIKNPDWPDVALQAAYASRCLERAPEALRWFQVAAQSHPDRARVMLELAREHCRFQAFAEAERCLSSIPALQRDAPEVLELHIELLARRDLTAARARIADALSAEQRRDAMIALARLGLRLGFQRESIAALQAFRPKGVNKIELVLAQCLIHAAEHLQARELIVPLAPTLTAADELEEFVGIARELCDGPLVQSALEKLAIRGEPSTAEPTRVNPSLRAARERARIALADGDSAACLQAIEPLISGSQPVALQDARLHIRARIDAEEIARGWDALRRFEGQFDERGLLEERVVLLRSDLRLDEEMSCLRDVAQRDPLDETFALRLVDALIVRGEIAAAEPIIRDWSKKRPAGQVWLRKYYDAAIARHQEWPPVMAECERAFGCGSPMSRLELSFEQIRIQRRAGQFAEAEAALDRFRSSLDSVPLERARRLRLEMDYAHELTWLGRHAEARPLLDGLLALPMPLAMRDDLLRIACANESFGGGDLARYMNLRNGLSRPRHHLSIAPFATSTSVPTPALRVIVLLHLFHPEQWPEFRERLSTIRGGATQLLVAIPEGFEAEACIVDILAFDAKARIVRVANRGFDVGSHWQALDTIDLRTFDVAMLLQTKKSSHTRIGPIWRRNLVNALIGTPERWRDNLRAFASNPQVGMIGSAWHQISFHPWTYPAMGEVLRALQMPTRFDEIKPIHEFVAGSMFMVRAPLLAEMHERTRGTIAFEPYELLGIARRSDESLAHAMERAFGLYVRWRGFEILWRP